MNYGKGSNPQTKTSETIRLRLDDAWDFKFSPSFKAPLVVDASSFGPSLRFITKKRSIESFFGEFRDKFCPFIMSGSGDFHHLTPLFVRQIKENFAIVSFDNHPDWDVRPPYWSCGAWVNRALENPLIQKVAVWGCGSFECTFPWRLLGNRLACRSDRLWIAPWQSEGKDYPSWLHPVLSGNWQTHFTRFVESIRSLPVYVTVDLDCLSEEESVTNWENGRYAVSDIVWALTLLRQNVRIIGGDLCGALSTSRYGSRFQSVAGRFDHPRPRAVSEEARRTINMRALESIWPCLIGESLS